jgi:hypothetical protein
VSCMVTAKMGLAVSCIVFTSFLCGLDKKSPNGWMPRGLEGEAKCAEMVIT